MSEEKVERKVAVILAMMWWATVPKLSRTRLRLYRRLRSAGRSFLHTKCGAVYAPLTSLVDSVNGHATHCSDNKDPAKQGIGAWDLGQ